MNKLNYTYVLCYEGQEFLTKIKLWYEHDSYDKTDKDIHINLLFNNVSEIHTFIFGLKILKRNINDEIIKIEQYVKIHRTDVKFIEIVRRIPKLEEDTDYWRYLLHYYPNLDIISLLEGLILFFEKNIRLDYKKTELPNCFSYFLVQSFWQGKIYLSNSICIKNQYINTYYNIGFKDSFLCKSMDTQDIDLALIKIINSIQKVIIGEMMPIKILVENMPFMFDTYFIIENEISKYYGFMDVHECPEDIFNHEEAPYVGNIPTICLLNFMENYKIFNQNFST